MKLSLVFQTALFVHAGLFLLQTHAQEYRPEKSKLSLLPEEVREQDSIRSYVQRHGIKEKPLPSGLIFISLEEGQGMPAVNGKRVKISYKAYLTDGTLFDASPQKYPIEFPLGSGYFIRGLEEGIMLMKTGGKAKFILPSKLAYGDRGQGKIPPFTPLVFIVELLGVK